MTSTPSIPKAKKTFAGLDDLIAESVAKEATYHNQSEEKQDGSVREKVSYDEARTDLAGEQASAQSAPLTPSRRVSFRITLPENVVIGTKLEAVKRSSSAAAIVELALRQYLDLRSAD